jgi:plasmid maintenance system antidote protein VapI
MRSELDILTSKVKALKEEEERISQQIEFQLGQETRLILQFFENLQTMMSQSEKHSVEGIQRLKQRSLLLNEEVKKSFESLYSEVRQKLDMFQKIGSAADFSPLINAARGEYVDLNALRPSVIRAMGIMHSRMNSMLNSKTKDLLQKAIDSLESSFLIPL